MDELDAKKRGDGAVSMEESDDEGVAGGGEGDVEDEQESEEGSEYEYTYEGDGGEEGEDAAPEQNQWLQEHYKKKRWQEKEKEMRARMALEEAEREESLKKAGAAAGKGKGKGKMGAAVKGKVDQIFTSAGSSIVLTSDLLQMQREEVELGLSVEAISDNIYKWRVVMSGFDPSSSLSRDLAKLRDRYGYDYVEMELSFKIDLYPFFPPQVKLVRPRFEGFMMGRIACLEILQLSHWSSVNGMKSVLLGIRDALQSWARLDVENSLNDIELHPGGSYTDLEHMLLRLGLITEVRPQAAVKNNEQSTGDEAKGKGSSSEKKRKWSDSKKPREAATSETLLAAGAAAAALSSSHTSSQQKVDELNAKTKAATGGGAAAKGGGGGAGGEAQPQAVKGGKQGNYWAKGTGYGHSDSGKPSWDVESFLAAQREKDRLVEDLLQRIREFLQPAKGNGSRGSPVDIDQEEESLDPEAVEKEEARLAAVRGGMQVLEESCLVPLLQQYLECDSLLDMDRHASLYAIVFNLVRSLASWKQLSGLLLSLGGQSDSRKCLYRLLCKQSELAKVYVSTRAKAGQATSDSAAPEDSHLMELVLEVMEEVEAAVDKEALQRLEGRDTKTADGDQEEEDKDKGREEEAAALRQYSAVMGPLQYDDIDDLPGFRTTVMASAPVPKPKHPAAATAAAKAAAAAVAGGGGGGGSRERVKRLAQEHADLVKSLPLNLSSSIFARAHSTCMDKMQSIVSGPEDTPYSAGLFLFDVYFPMRYPYEAPKVSLQTTGHGTVRFNPNLYNNGKVCLSLLGTWEGKGGETWHPATSTILQVLVSIQSLILVPQPFFNEPGYERQLGTPQGDKQNRAYNAVIRAATVEYAMLDMLLRPPKGWEGMVRAHFFLRRDFIKAQTAEWIKEAKVDPVDKAHLDKLSTLAARLGTALDKLKPPPGLGSAASATISK